MPLSVRTKPKGKNYIDPSKWVAGRIFDTQLITTSWNYDASTNIVTIDAPNISMVSQRVVVTRNTNYAVSGIQTGTNFYVYTSSGVALLTGANSGASLNSGNNSELIVSIYRPSGSTGSVKMKDTQLEIGTTTTTFEPFRGLIPDLATAPQVRQTVTDLKLAVQVLQPVR